MQISGILNLSTDSFSDGREWTVEEAVARGVRLREDGAHWIDVGAVSSHPDSGGLTVEQELRVLEPVLRGLLDQGMAVAVDTFAPEVQISVAPYVGMLNDIRGFAEPTVWGALAEASCELVVMHSLQDGRADRRDSDPTTIVDDVLRFFDARLNAMVAAGIDERRLWVDPGMGFFVGKDPRSSVALLSAIPRLRAETGCSVYISVSRKSFLGALLGGRAVDARGPATLAAELFAVRSGAACIRTHDVRALRDAWTIEEECRAMYAGTV